MRCGAFAHEVEHTSLAYSEPGRRDSNAGMAIATKPLQEPATTEC